MSVSLLQTKIHAPTPPQRSGRTHHVSRPRLLQKLNAAIGKKLTLVCAPAGFGKSTLLGEWLAETTVAGVELSTGTRLSCAAAWLSLDAGDNDLIRFWSYFVAALQSLDAALGGATVAQLQTPQAFNHEAILTGLLNDLSARSGLLILVLDDYHLITTPAIHRGLLYLLEHLPPQLHIVLSSRADPPLTLARWRGQGQLTELRIDDLRFSAEEAAGFLQEVMGLQLTPQAIDALESRTEGWVAGLQLAALSIQGVADRDGFIARFSGSNRYIVDYLVEEVVSQQSEEVQSFLLQTSILEQLCGPLCDAVLEKNGSGAASQEILEGLEQANLFLLPLDDERLWFRYHHLFGDVLRLRLRKSYGAAIPQLHRRASQWYEEAGQIEAAVNHALAVPDLERAAILVERSALSILLHESKVYSARHLIAQIPLATIYLRPRLTLAYGITLTLFAQFDAVDDLLAKAAEARDYPDSATEVAGGFLVLRSLVARLRRESALSLELAQAALEILPADQLVLRGTALQNSGIAYIRLGESLQGQQFLKKSIPFGIEGQAYYMALVAYEEIASEQTLQGQLTEASRTCDEALLLAARWGSQFVPAIGIIHIVRGEILYEWNQLANATRALTDGLHLIQGTTEVNLLARGYAALARTQHAERASAALLTLQEAGERVDKMQIAVAWTVNAHARLALQRARMMLDQGEIAEARSWAEATQLAPDGAISSLQRHLLVRIRITQYASEPQPRLLEDAQRLLSEVAQVVEEKGWLALQIENRLLQALLFQVQRQRVAAQEALIHALILGQPQGYLRTFVDEGEALRAPLLEIRLGLARKSLAIHDEGFAAYLERILAALGQAPVTQATSLPQSHLSPQALIEPLTERETEILRLVEQGLSNNEIADQLIVTVGTVKKHLNNIFGKLDVTSRTQALASARALDLL